MAGTAQDPEASPEQAAKAAAAATDAPKDAPTYPLERLQAEASDLLGCDSWVAAGALSSQTKKSLSVPEAQAAVKAWLATPVKEEK